MKWGCVFGLLCICSTTNAQLQDSIRQQTLKEVVVKSQATDRHINDVPIGAEKINVETMSRLPAMFGERDIIKGIQLLPGVKGEADGMGGYQVRGGTSAQNHILLDGASVYNTGHLFGLFSAFNDDAIGSAELFKGLMPPRYGGGSSSVLTMGTRSGDPVRHHFSATIGLLSAKMEADGPMGHNGSSYLVAGRTSYLNIFIKASGKYADNSLTFNDFNAKLNFKFSSGDQLYLALFRGHDGVKVEEMVNMKYNNTTGTLGWLHSQSAEHTTHTQLIASSYDTDQGMEVYSYDVNMKGFNRQLTLRHQQTWTPDRHHTFNAGGETTLMDVKSASWRIVSNNECEQRNGWFTALWASDDISLFKDRLTLSAGLRCEWFSVLGGKPYYHLDDNGDILDTLHYKSGSIVKTYTSLQPRLSLTWKMGPNIAFKAGYSRLAQVVQPIRNSSMSLPIDRLAMASNIIKPLIADQVAGGFSAMTSNGAWDVSADVYYKKLQNVYDLREGKTFNNEIELERIIIGGRGRAYGLELAAYKNKGRTTGWVAYTLSWVQNQIDGIMNGQWYTAPNDRRHDFVVVVMSQLSPRWNISSSWRYTSGQAMTAPAAKYELGSETHYYYGPRNINRAPDYHRLDLSAAHSTTKGKATRTWTFGLFNAYCRFNPFLVTFKEDSTKPSGTKAVVTSVFGIIPTISYTYKY